MKVAKIPSFAMTPLVKLAEKPATSKIQLVKKPTSLSVYVPPLGFHPSMGVIIVFATFWNGMVLIGLSSALRHPQFPTSLLILLFMTPFLAIGGFLVFACLFCFFGQTYLQIDQRTIHYVRLLFGQRVSRLKPLPTNEIQRLTLIRKHWYRDGDGDRREQPAELRIGIGIHKISLGGTGGGIDDEAAIDWLGYEISQWLNMPLEIIE
jgi:hypothetical protein